MKPMECHVDFFLLIKVTNVHQTPNSGSRKRGERRVFLLVASTASSDKNSVDFL